jgi:hypothetical protein
MTNPFESASTQQAKKIPVEYHNERIIAETGENYRLTWPDGRWLIMEYKEDHSKTMASSDADSRHITPSLWMVDSTSGGPAWINREQLQVLGELIKRKEQEYNHSNKQQRA